MLAIVRKRRKLIALANLAHLGLPTFAPPLAELSAPALEVLLALAGSALPVFVDTGAFSEVELGPLGWTVVAPIDDVGWRERLAVMRRIATALGPQAYLVAPDRVGDQAETLARLRRHADDLRDFRALGSRIIVPLQRGELTPRAFDTEAGRALGFGDFVRGVPANKAPMPTGEFDDFLRAVRPPAVHLLGMGPKSPRFPKMVDVLRRLVPSAEVSSDSNLLSANVGLTNGRAGTMRALTAAMHANAPGSSNVGPMHLPSTARPPSS